MHLVIPQHSKAARRNGVPSDLRMCTGQLKVVQTCLTATLRSRSYISKVLSWLSDTLQIRKPEV